MENTDYIIANQDTQRDKLNIKKKLQKLENDVLNMKELKELSEETQ